MSDTVETQRLSGPGFDELLVELERLTPELEAPGAWPARQFRQLAEHGVLGWVIPRRWGGADVSPAELVRGYESLARACLVSTFILTQRNGACQRIAAAHDELQARLLPGLCRGETFATVGISHLTTSRQHLNRPAVQVERVADGFRFEGTAPWVTGAAHADYIVTGGSLDDGRQVLAVIETSDSRVTIQPAAELLALNASQTASVRLERVLVPDSNLIAGPVNQVMKHVSGGGTGSLTTSALALGCAAGALGRLELEAQRRPDLVEIHASLAAELAGVSADMHRAATGTSSDECFSSESIRKRANSLVLRSTQAYLAASKGAGFTAGHPAGRGVREAMFFLVWSCPQPVLQAALREFACVLQ